MAGSEVTDSVGRSGWRPLLIALLGLCAALALADGATAAAERVYVVNVPGDEEEVEQCESTSPCTLRAAIERANEDEEPSTIEFSEAFVAPIEVAAGPLPPIEEPVTIDATSVAELGDPGIVLEGVEEEGAGLDVRAGPTAIAGLAIGDFESGIEISAAATVQVCRTYLGAFPTGGGHVLEAPNLVGVHIDESAQGAAIGHGCSGQNVISGNDEYGVVDEGMNTVVAGSLIGTDRAGDTVPNGEKSVLGAGVDVKPAAKVPRIGAGQGDSGNTIAFNSYSGVEVEAPGSSAQITANSIHDNQGPGIVVQQPFGIGKPLSPVLAHAWTGLSDMSVGGQLSGAPSALYSLEFFANDACDKSGAGEGRTYLGSDLVETDAAGDAGFSAEGIVLPPSGQSVITATETEVQAGTTSEFSRCVPTTPAPPIGGPPGESQIVLPENGASVALGTRAGTIRVRKPGQKGFHPLGDGEIVPVGTVVDATHGKVTLTSVDDKGKAQAATFQGGVFRIGQGRGKKLVVLRLLGGGLRGCPRKRTRRHRRHSRRDQVATASRRRGRHLWGSGKGSFRTVGNHGSATVRGTIWLTADRCDGTLFKVRRGMVRVRDFTRHRTVTLGKGKSYLAPAP